MSAPLQDPLLVLAIDQRDTSQGIWRLDRRRAYRGSSDWGEEPTA